MLYFLVNNSSVCFNNKDPFTGIFVHAWVKQYPSVTGHTLDVSCPKSITRDVVRPFANDVNAGDLQNESAVQLYFSKNNSVKFSLLIFGLS